MIVIATIQIAFDIAKDAAHVTWTDIDRAIKDSRSVPRFKVEEAEVNKP